MKSLNRSKQGRYLETRYPSWVVAFTMLALWLVNPWGGQTGPGNAFAGVGDAIQTIYGKIQRSPFDKAFYLLYNNYCLTKQVGKYMQEKAHRGAFN